MRPLAKELYNWAEDELAAQIHKECGHMVLAREEENVKLVARVARTLALQVGFDCPSIPTYVFPLPRPFHSHLHPRLCGLYVVSCVLRAAALQEANYLAYRNEGARLLTTLAAINHDHEVRTAERNTLCCNAVQRGAIAVGH